MRIEIHERREFKPNGDRDTLRHPCSSFKVVIVTDAGKSAVVFENSQWDRFFSHIKGTRQQCLTEAQEKAIDIGKIIGAEVELIPFTLPSEIEALKERIENDQKRLNELQEQAKQSRL